MGISMRHRWKNSELNLGVLIKAARRREHFIWVLKVEFIRRIWKWSRGGRRRTFQAEGTALSKSYARQTM